MNTNIAYLHKFRFVSQCGQYVRFLVAADLIELLGVSRATAYRIVQQQRISQVQRELLELKVFGLIPGWHGWQILPGELVDPYGYRYQIGEILSIPHLRAVCQSDYVALSDSASLRGVAPNSKSG